MTSFDARGIKGAGVFGWNYNRQNFKYDQQQRWQRYTTGRTYAVEQATMFREDVTDLANVAMTKLKIYAPIMTMSCGYCVTIFVEGRSGLKFPGPPVFVSGLYLQCLGVGFAFLTLGTWLVFHAALNAQVAATQLRTRKVRLPVPSQRQLDSARKLLSNWEEENWYDIFKLPFIMPNTSKSPNVSDDEKTGNIDDLPSDMKTKFGGKGTKKKGKGVKAAAAEYHKKVKKEGVKMPGTTSGVPSWIKREMQMREMFPKGAPSGHGIKGATEPYEHFELVRQAQKDWWGAEAYARINMLYGMMHLIQAFAYWLVIHNVGELAMVWCSIICASALCTAVWLMFRLDVLPESGGCFPVEASGPFVAAVALSLMYSHSPTDAQIDLGRALAILIGLMHVLWTFRLYAIAQPTNNLPSDKAKESGGELFNETASSSVPSWLPSAFQHVTYLIAPPKSKKHMGRELHEKSPTFHEDPLTNVDMTPWLYTRTLLVAVLVGWLVLLGGRVVEAEDGERMLVTNPGTPPWTRKGMWYGWEFGAISSKHYAHVTPQRGHFAWQKGWGPQGQQELWSSDVFGFSPEADSWWSEDGVPGAAGLGENNWNTGVIKYQSPGEPVNSPWTRRLRSLPSDISRPVVPAAVTWPPLFEPEFLVCGHMFGKGGQVAAFTGNGLGAIIAEDVASGRASSGMRTISLQGLLPHGSIRGVTASNSSLLVLSDSGEVVSCPFSTASTGTMQCKATGAPPLQAFSAGDDETKLPAVVVDAEIDRPMFAVVASPSGRLQMFQLKGESLPTWQHSGDFQILGDGFGVASITASHQGLLVMTTDGAIHQLKLTAGQNLEEVTRETPKAGPNRSWHSACVLSDSSTVRLASRWARASQGSLAWHPELLL